MLSRAAIYALTPQGARLAVEIAGQIRRCRLHEPDGCNGGRLCKESGEASGLQPDVWPVGLDDAQVGEQSGKRTDWYSDRQTGQLTPEASGTRVFLAAGLQDFFYGAAGSGMGLADFEAEECAPVFFERFGRQLAENFREFPCHILICASGIALRSLAPLLESKDKDPAVLLLDQCGRFVISLLSGHLGGANRAARKLASVIGGTAVITTATDCEGLPSIDEIAAQRNLRIENLEAVRTVNAALLRGGKIWLWDNENLLGLRGSEHEKHFRLPGAFDRLPENAGRMVDRKPSSGSDEKNGLAENAILPAIGRFSGNSGPFRHFMAEIGSFRKKSEENELILVLVDPPLKLAELDEFFAEPPVCSRASTLILRSKSYWLGLGCKRGTDPQKLESFAAQALQTRGLTWSDLAGVASIDLKRDEEAILHLARRHRLRLRFFAADELDAVCAPSPSCRVKEIIGTASVCEAAAMLAAGYPAENTGDWCGTLLLPKQKGTGMTLALAVSRNCGQEVTFWNSVQQTACRNRGTPSGRLCGPGEPGCAGAVEYPSLSNSQAAGPGNSASGNGELKTGGSVGRCGHDAGEK